MTPDPHMHQMQCCPACWRGQPSHVSEIEDGWCECEIPPPMTEADLLAYDVGAVLAGTLALSELSPEEAAAVTAAIDEPIRLEVATDTWLYELLHEPEQPELRRQGPCDSYQEPENRAAGACECATCGLPPESHRGDAQ